MPRKAISLTLDRDNLVWLQGQARAAQNGSVSQIVDRLVSEARAAGRVEEASVRSVVGTIRIRASDPDLAQADAAVRALFPGPPQRDGSRSTPARASRLRARAQRRRG